MPVSRSWLPLGLGHGMVSHDGRQKGLYDKQPCAILNLSTRSHTHKFWKVTSERVTSGCWGEEEEDSSSVFTNFPLELLHFKPQISE